MSGGSFRTKAGRCHIEGDRLRLERTGWRGALSDVVYGNTMLQARLVYGGVAVACGIGVLYQVRAGSWPSAFVLALLAGLAIRTLIRSRGVSAAPSVPRSAITRIEGRAARSGLTRAMLIVRFEQDGRALERFIMLPGSMADGSGEYQRAVGLLREAGLEVHEA